MMLEIRERKNKIKFAATIQARMGSTRLPGKVLKDILGKPMLLWQIERLRESKYLEEIIVATTESKVDDQIVDFCQKNNVSCYRGSENNVIDRIASLLQKFNIINNVECFGDSPLVDPKIIDEYIEIFNKSGGNYDYLSNCIKTSYPPGLEVIIYKSETLINLNDFLDKEDPLREHVGFNITRFPKKFNIKSMVAPIEYTMPDFYLEVDSNDDFILINEIFKHFANINQLKFYLFDILNLLKKKPELKNINNKTHRRWKTLRNENS